MTYPFIYLRDTASSGEFRGMVKRIEHGLQSVFNREYLIYHFDRGFGKEFSAWHCYLSLVERHPATQAGLPFIDDHVRIIDPYAPQRGRDGYIRALWLEGDEERFQVRDAEFLDPNGVESYPHVQAAMDEKYRAVVDSVSDDDEFQAFVREFRLPLVEPYQRSNARNFYLASKGRDIELALAMDPDYRRLERLQAELLEESKFTVRREQFELLERSPVNVALRF